MTLQLVSLFAGIGGFDLAAEKVGIEPVVAVELDPAARGVLAHRFPTTKLFNDVKDVTGDDLRTAGCRPESTIVTAGFPCQDVSVAGKRAGLAGARTGMFWHIIRILDEFRPATVVLENVPGLLTSQSGRDFGAVVGALGESGYGVSWRVLDAQHFGVPQRRRRVIVVGCFGDDGTASRKILAITESGGRDFGEGGTAGENPIGAVEDRPVGALTRSGLGGGGGADDQTAQAGHLVMWPRP